MRTSAIWKGLFTKLLAASGIEFASEEKIQVYAGDPNGVITAPKGSLVMDTVHGRTWVNSDGATTWTDSVRALGAITGEPTGVENPDQWSVTYDPATRTVTATPTGTQKIFVRGVEFVFSAPVALAHAAASGTYFFEIDSTGALTVGGTPFDFENKAQIAVVSYDTTQTPMGFALRETHGLAMDWATHLEFHDKDGTYLVSGGGLTAGTYTVYDPGAGDNPLLATIAPGVPTTVVADEDLRSTLAVLADGGPYQQLRFDWVAVKWLWVSNAEAPYYRVANVPYYNPSSGGANLTALVSNDYCCYYLVQIPVTNDAGSQAFRQVWIPGQQKYTPASPNTAQRTVARNLALAEDPFAPGVLLLDPLPSSEFVITAKIVVHYLTSFTNNDYRLRIEGYQKINRTRTGGGSGSAAVTLPTLLDTNVAITTASAVGALDPAVESNQRLVNERYAQFGYVAGWVTATAYRVGNVVKVSDKMFRCLTAHTSGTWYTDFAAARWEMLGGVAGRITTANDTPTAVISSIILPFGETTMSMLVKIGAHRPATSISKCIILEYGAKRVGGNVTVFKIAERATEEVGMETCSAEVDVTATNTIRVMVTGLAASDVIWQAVLEHSFF